MLRMLCRAYDVMLLAYPAEFRREYGREMAIAFSSRARAELQHGTLSFLIFLADILRDWVRTVAVERIEASAARAASGIAVTSIFAANNIARVPGNAGGSGPVWVLLGGLGAFLLIDGWVRWFA